MPCRANCQKHYVLIEILFSPEGPIIASISPGIAKPLISFRICCLLIVTERLLNLKSWWGSLELSIFGYSYSRYLKTILCFNYFGNMSQMNDNTQIRNKRLLIIIISIILFFSVRMRCLYWGLFKTYSDLYNLQHITIKLMMNSARCNAIYVNIFVLLSQG